MLKLLGLLFGIPATREERSRLLTNLSAGQSGPEVFARLLDGIQHNTGKAGALLAAQGIFAAAAMFGMDHGWPKTPALASVLLLLVGSLLLMSTLRSTGRPFRETMDPEEHVRKVFALLASRIVRFNIALYLTFLSIVLLILGAVLSIA